MAHLQDLARELELKGVRTTGATGNLVFECEGLTCAQLEQRLEAAFEFRFGKRVAIIVRSDSAWRRLLANNPFDQVPALEPANVVVRVTRAPIVPGVQSALARYIGSEQVAVVDGDLWIHFPDGPERSRLPSALASNAKLGVGTLRTLNTLRRVGDLL
jgi:uncharacterized protein (DUF1697 family)